MPLMRTLTQEAVPGANEGEAFTASIANRPVQPQVGEAYWDSLMVSFGGTASTADVTFTTMLDVLQPLQFLANEPRILLRGRDMVNLHSAFYGVPPANMSGTATTDRDYAMGVRIPLWIKPKAGESYSWNATRVSQTNLGTERLQIGLAYRRYASNTGRIDARELPYTTPGATGITTVTSALPKNGRLLGLLVFSNTVPIVSADSATVQRVFIDSPTTRLVDAHINSLTGAMRTQLDYASGGANALALVMRNYGWLDLRDDPIDLRGPDISLKIDAQETSAASRFVPVVEVPQA